MCVCVAVAPGNGCGKRGVERCGGVGEWGSGCGKRARARVASAATRVVYAMDTLYLTLLELELGWVDEHELFMSADVLPSFPASLGFCCSLLVRACLSPPAVVQAIWPAGGYRWPNGCDHVALRCHVCCGECV